MESCLTNVRLLIEIKSAVRGGSWVVVGGYMIRFYFFCLNHVATLDAVRCRFAVFSSFFSSAFSILAMSSTAHVCLCVDEFLS